MIDNIKDNSAATSTAWQEMRLTTLKRFVDDRTPTKAYAYHVTKIEVLAGTIGNDLSDTTPNANTPITNQEEAYPDLTADSLLNGVRDVNGVLFLPLNP